MNTINPKTPIPSFFITADFTEEPNRFPQRLKVKELRDWRGFKNEISMDRSHSDNSRNLDGTN